MRQHYNIPFLCLIQEETGVSKNRNGDRERVIQANLRNRLNLRPPISFTEGVMVGLVFEQPCLAVIATFGHVRIVVSHWFHLFSFLFPGYFQWYCQWSVGVHVRLPCVFELELNNSVKLCLLLTDFVIFPSSFMKPCFLWLQPRATVYALELLVNSVRFWIDQVDN